MDLWSTIGTSLVIGIVATLAGNAIWPGIKGGWDRCIQTWVLTSLKAQKVTYLNVLRMLEDPTYACAMFSKMLGNMLMMCVALLSSVAAQILLSINREKIEAAGYYGTASVFILTLAVLAAIRTGRIYSRLVTYLVAIRDFEEYKARLEQKWGAEHWND